MPELPEVETIKKTLQTQIIGKTVAEVQIHYLPLVRAPQVTDFCTTLIGQTLHDIGRLGKYLLFRFDRHTLVSHLRMEGKFFLRTKADYHETHEHAVITFTDDSDLRYHDVRKFGTMELIPLEKERSAAGINTLGPEPFDPVFTEEYLWQFHTSNRPIKALLLDQTIVAGLGNIYVDETLYHARIHPSTSVSQLNQTDIALLVKHSRAVLEKAIALGGTSIRTYLSSIGITGRFQNELSVHTRVHQPCLHCHTEIVKIRVAGRGTYFCSNCQIKK